MGMPGRAYTLTGASEYALTGRPLLASSLNYFVSMSAFPGFVYFMSDEGNGMIPVGASKLSGNSLNSMIMGISVLRDKAYAVSSTSGIFVIDIDTAIYDWQNEVRLYGESGAKQRLIQANTAAFTSSIGKSIPTGVNGSLNTVLQVITAADFVHGGVLQPLILATGAVEVPLMVVNPSGNGSSAVLYGPDEVSTSLGTLYGGTSITTGFIGNMPVALVTGKIYGSVTNALAVYDMTIPGSPVLTGLMALDGLGGSVAMVGETAYVGLPGKTIIVNLSDPQNPVVTGEIAGFGGRVSVTKEGMAYAIETSNGNIKSASLAPAVPLIDAPEAIFADIDRLTAEDMVINYRILGNLTPVDSAVIEIRDDAGDIVFSEQVPVQAEGQVIWPAGQPMNPTPNDIRFQVENPDGTRSEIVNSWPEITFGSTPTPILTLVNPWHVVRGATGSGAIVTLTGRNFRATSTVVFESDNGNTVIQLPASFTDNTKLTVLLPTTLTSNVISGTVRVLNGGIESDTHILKIVEYALPDAPVLSSITPSQLNSSWNPVDTWITIHGSNFIDNDTIVESDHIPSELETEFVSVNELRALVPAVWMSGPARIHLRAVSLSDSDIVSQEITLEVLNTIMLNLPPMAPIIYGVNGSQDIANGYVPLAASPSSASTTVKITGEGFISGAKVRATINGKRYDLATEFINSRDLSTTVTSELFSRRNFTATLTLYSAGISNGTEVQEETSIMEIQASILPPRVFKQAPGGKHSFRDHRYGIHYKYIEGDEQEQIHIVVPEDSFSRIAVVSQPNKEWNNVTYRVISPDGSINASEYVSIEQWSPNKSLIDQIIDYLSGVNSQRNSSTIIELHGLGESIYGNGLPINNLDTYKRINLEVRKGILFPKTLAEARIWLMPHREYDVKVHFIADKTNTVDTTPESFGKIKKNDLERMLNNTWIQANVSFNVVSIDDTITEIDFDANNNKLDVTNFCDEGTECGIILDTIVPSENRNPYNGKIDKDGSIHVYYVKEFDSSNVRGFAPIGWHHVFIGDAGSKGTTVTHEIGHALGLMHNQEETRDSWLFNAKDNDDCKNTGICKDSDYYDETSLMWFRINGNSHIGSPYWKRLNEVKCYKDDNSSNCLMPMYDFYRPY